MIRAGAVFTGYRTGPNTHQTKKGSRPAILVGREYRDVDLSHGFGKGGAFQIAEIAD
jgi:hypothetical protein